MVAIYAGVLVPGRGPLLPPSAQRGEVRRGALEAIYAGVLKAGPGLGVRRAGNGCRGGAVVPINAGILVAERGRV